MSAQLEAALTTRAPASSNRPWRRRIRDAATLSNTDIAGADALEELGNATGHAVRRRRERELITTAIRH
jgi:hypothetical protein